MVEKSFGDFLIVLIINKMGILRRMLILIENVLSEYINKMGLLYRMLIGLVDQQNVYVAQNVDSG